MSTTRGLPHASGISNRDESSPSYIRPHVEEEEEGSAAVTAATQPTPSDMDMSTTTTNEDKILVEIIKELRSIQETPDPQSAHLVRCAKLLAVLLEEKARLTEGEYAYVVDSAHVILLLDNRWSHMRLMNRLVEKLSLLHRDLLSIHTRRLAPPEQESQPKNAPAPVDPPDLSSLKLLHSWIQFGMFVSDWKFRAGMDSVLADTITLLSSPNSKNQSLANPTVQEKVTQQDRNVRRIRELLVQQWSSKFPAHVDPKLVNSYLNPATAKVAHAAWTWDDEVLKQIPDGGERLLKLRPH